MRSRKERKTVVEASEENYSAVSSIVGEVIRCRKLNIRKTPDPNGAIVGVLDAGEKVTVDLTTNDPNYYAIATKGEKKGYVVKTYISVIE